MFEIAENEVILSAIGLQLYGFHLLDPSDSIPRKMGLLRAYYMAITLITRIQQLDSNNNFMKYCPASYFRAASLSALFILKLHDSSYVTLLDSEGGSHAFTTALALIRRASLEDNDLPERISTILLQLWSQQGRSTRSKKEPALISRTRMAASLLHEQLWIWRETFGGQESASGNPPSGISSREFLLFLNLVFANTYFDIDIVGRQQASGFYEEHSDTVAPGNSDLKSFTFDEVFDMDMLSLLPVGIECDLSFNSTSPVAEDFS
jgi:hypothetical protein